MIETRTFKITGESPLLLHSTKGMLSQGDGGGLKTKQIPLPKDEAELGAYRLANGNLYLLAVGFRGSIINKGGGASGRRIGKGTANSHCSAGLMINDKYAECALYHPETGKPLKNYEIDTRPAVVQRARVMRSRPRLNEWACDVTFDIDTDFITVQQVLELLNISGRMAGVGDYRPQCKGWFGKYRAELKN